MGAGENIMNRSFSQLMVLSALLFAGLLLGGCGARNAGPEQQNTVVTGTGTATPCTADAQCGGGICSNGYCIGGTGVAGTGTGGPSQCQSHSHCSTNQFCQFPTGTVYDINTKGNCANACSGANPCPAGQQCQAGVCYTNYDCAPAQNSADCPGGEVCNRQTRTCSAPPSTCYFNEDCPHNWICNGQNSCTNPGDLGSCNTVLDCNNIAACQNGACTCQSGRCRSQTCQSATDCATGQYCERDSCQPAPSCTEQSNCTPYGLVCDGGQCVNPQPCQSGNFCQSGFECFENLVPPGCLPEGSSQCSRNEQCPPNSYCNSFTSKCQSGCRDINDCVGKCPGSPVCACGSSHTCTTNMVGMLGDVCNSDEDCPGGTRCAPDDPQAGIMCSLGGGLGGAGGGQCVSSCRQVCDILASKVVDTCPQGQSCGGDGDIGQILMQLLGATSGSNGSVCY